MASRGARSMQASDAQIVCEISADAGKRFAAVAAPRIAACTDDPPFTVAELIAYIDAGHAWVATEDDDVVGFVVTDIIHDVVHIEEIDVSRHAGLTPAVRAVRAKESALGLPADLRVVMGRELGEALPDGPTR